MELERLQAPYAELDESNRWDQPLIFLVISSAHFTKLCLISSKLIWQFPM
jgi:hypothetical protein